MPKLKRVYGDKATIRLVPEGRPLVLFSRVDYTKEIFASDPATFHAGKANAVLGPIMGEHSLLLVDHDEHKRARKLLMPAFRPSAMTGYRALIEDITNDQVGRLPVGEEFASLEAMNALTLEVILQVVFGVVDEAVLSRLRPLVTATVDVRPAVLLGWGYPPLRRFGMWKRAAETKEKLDEILYAEIAQRRLAHDLAERSDVLSQLLTVGSDEAGEEKPLTDPELRDQLVTLLLAGHETTASGLAWALYELGRNPEVLHEAQRAVDTGNDEFVEAVFKESLRLHPIIPMVVRFLTKPGRIGEVDLPAGVSVGPSILLSHADPSNFPAPDEFRPLRFLDGSVKPNTWIPFGGGVRRCIGAGFSLAEGTIVLRTVLSRYDIGVLPGHDDAPRVRNITSVPDQGARIVLRARRT